MKPGEKDIIHKNMYSPTFVLKYYTGVFYTICTHIAADE